MRLGVLAGGSPWALVAMRLGGRGSAAPWTPWHQGSAAKTQDETGGPREGPGGVSCQTTASWTLPDRRQTDGLRPPPRGSPPDRHVSTLTSHSFCLSAVGSLFCCFMRFSSLLVELYLFLSCTTNCPGDSVEAFYGKSKHIRSRQSTAFSCQHLYHSCPSALGGRRRVRRCVQWGNGQAPASGPVSGGKRVSFKTF